MFGQNFVMQHYKGLCILNIIQTFEGVQHGDG